MEELLFWVAQICVFLGTAGTLHFSPKNEAVIDGGTASSTGNEQAVKWRNYFLILAFVFVVAGIVLNIVLYYCIK